MRRFLVSICAAMLAFGAAARVVAQQEPDRAEVLEKLEGKLRTVRHVAFHPAIVRAVRIQNNEQLSMELIQERDSQWRSSQEQTTLQRTIMSSRASEALKKLVEQNPDFNEAFATDKQGANVAMFPATSDYWQGDEDKWIESFNQGDGRLWIGEIEVDESTGLAAVQVSVPIIDQGATIGVLVIGVTQDYLQK